MRIIISGTAKKSTNIRHHLSKARKRVSGTAVTIIPTSSPYDCIAVFRASGAMDFLIDGTGMGVSAAGLDTQFVEGLPTMLMKPLSGAGAGYDAGCDEHLRRGFVHRPPLFHRARIERHDFLRRRPLFRQCRNPQHLLYGPLFATGRFSRAVAAVTMTYLFFT